jgi:hypothetical protein
MGDFFFVREAIDSYFRCRDFPSGLLRGFRNTEIHGFRTLMRRVLQPVRALAARHRDISILFPASWSKLSYNFPKTHTALEKTTGKPMKAPILLSCPDHSIANARIRNCPTVAIIIIICDCSDGSGYVSVAGATGDCH